MASRMRMQEGNWATTCNRWVRAWCGEKKNHRLADYKPSKPVQPNPAAPLRGSCRAYHEPMSRGQYHPGRNSIHEKDNGRKGKVDRDYRRAPLGIATFLQREQTSYDTSEAQERAKTELNGPTSHPQPVCRHHCCQANQKAGAVESSRTAKLAGTAQSADCRTATAHTEYLGEGRGPVTPEPYRQRANRAVGLRVEKRLPRRGRKRRGR